MSAYVIVHATIKDPEKLTYEDCLKIIEKEMPKAKKADPKKVATKKKTVAKKKPAAKKKTTTTKKKK